MSAIPARRPMTCLGAWAVVAALTLGASACGSDEESAGSAHSTHDPAPTGEAEPTTTAAPEPHEGPIDVTLVDYGFEGLPGLVAAGPHTVTVTNEGTETHELFLFANPDDLTLEEIHALGPEGAPQAVAIEGLVYVGPGETKTFDADLPPGEYEAVCFIPAASDSRPHFAHGMHAVIQVQ
jgi:hypothetical protein